LLSFGSIPASFAVGLEHAKKLTSWSFDLPYEANSELFLLSSACIENWLPVVHQVRTQIPVSSIAEPEGSLLTPFELAPAARAVMGDNGLKEVQAMMSISLLVTAWHYDWYSLP